MDRIPLFPLNVVLFPGMPLPLRIFEPRYHAMLRDCEAAGRGFGVVLIAAGPEVGGFAEPHEVGTLARIERRQDQGGVVFILARGTRRFRVHRTFRDKPYLTGEVEWIPEPEAGEPSEDVAALVRRFGDYLVLLAKVAKVEVADEIQDLVRKQHAARPWPLACAVGGALLVDPGDQQRLLEAASPQEALDLERALLDREMARLRVLARSTDAHLN